MSDWEDSYDIGGDGVPDDFDSVADFDDGTDYGGDDFGDFDDGASVGDLVSPVGDADAWIVDLDLGGLADVADIAVVIGGDDVGSLGDEGGGPTDLGDVAAGEPLGTSLLAHDLTDVPDGTDPFASLVGRRLDDAELRNEIRNLRVKPPFAPRAAAEEEPATPPR